MEGTINFSHSYFTIWRILISSNVNSPFEYTWDFNFEEGFSFEIGTIFASNCFAPFLPGQPKFRSKHARSSFESRHGSATIGLYNCHPFVSRPLTRPRVISRVISPSVRTLSPGILVNKIVQFNSAKGIIRESLIKTRKPVLRHNFPRIYHTFPLDFDFSKSQYR